MNFYVLTLFPEMIKSGLNHSIIKRACDKKIINIEYVYIRDFALNKHKHVDDYPYGGGAGMVIKPQPVYDAYMSIKDKSDNAKVLYMTPQGKVFNQQMAITLSKEENIVILCGHYEGIDERVIEEITTDEVSIGDYILTGGELAAMVIIDSVSRLKEGVLGRSESFIGESFMDDRGKLLEYPQYTRPAEFRGRVVPEVLLSGHHKNIDAWRREQSQIRTLKKRPDLLKITTEDME